MSLSILSWVFTLFSLVFFLYEFFIVKNPFFDPFPAFLIWALCLAMGILWIIRVRGTRQK